VKLTHIISRISMSPSSLPGLSPHPRRQDDEFPVGFDEKTERDNLGIGLRGTMVEDPAYVQLARDREGLKSRLTMSLRINDCELVHFSQPVDSIDEVQSIVFLGEEVSGGYAEQWVGILRRELKNLVVKPAARKVSSRLEQKIDSGCNLTSRIHRILGWPFMRRLKNRMVKEDLL
jgi:hypothetical protein